MIIRKTPFFQKQLKRLAKTYAHVSDDCQEALDAFQPERCFDLGAGLFKIRVKNSDIPCGKSGGYRIIAFFQVTKHVLVPLIVYSKRDRENVTEQEIEHALETVLHELQDKNANIQK